MQYDRQTVAGNGDYVSLPGRMARGNTLVVAGSTCPDALVLEGTSGGRRWARRGGSRAISWPFCWRWH